VFLDPFVMTTEEEGKAKQEDIAAAAAAAQSTDEATDDATSLDANLTEKKGSTQNNTLALNDRDKLYDLCATVNHYGSAGGGHYTAYGLNKQDGKWYCCDDSKVYALKEGHPIVTGDTYMLFYQRQGLDEQDPREFLPESVRAKLGQAENSGPCTIM
jgi:hypothetical protein